MKKSIVIILSLLSLNCVAKDHYKITEIKDSDYVGSVYTVSKPLAYIENLSHCNKVEKYVAQNTACLMHEKANFKLTNIVNNCTNCIDSERLIKPLRLKLKENVELEVVKAYNVESGYLTSRFFSSPIAMLLLKDGDNNLIEMMEVETHFYFNGKASREEQSISIYSDNDFIVSQFCFFDQILPSAKQYQNVEQFLKDFDLEDTIKLEKRTCPFKTGNQGFVMITENFESYLTVRYYLSSWNVYGKWMI